MKLMDTSSIILFLELISQYERADNDLNIRLFNSEDYGHYKFSDLDAIKEMYPYDETEITLDSFNPNIIKKKSY